MTDKARCDEFIFVLVDLDVNLEKNTEGHYEFRTYLVSRKYVSVSPNL